MTITIYASLCRGCGEEPARLCRHSRNGRWYLYRGATCALRAVRKSRDARKAWKRQLSEEWR